MGAELEGLVLCRVGEHRLAFPASKVVQISDWAIGGIATPTARAAFSLPAINGRRVEDGLTGLIVDSVEIGVDAFELLPVPVILQGSAGGSLRGFIVLAGALCPVLAVTEFAQYLARTHP